MRQRPTAAFSAKSDRRRRIASVFGTFCLVQTLSGCFVDTEKPDLALDLPERYRFARAAVETALPALDWWRGFRSHELTLLI